jgi:ElaB/YqjD/DUF883 family membrane-anchored ribosome-binding protein
MSTPMYPANDHLHGKDAHGTPPANTAGLDGLRAQAGTALHDLAGTATGLVRQGAHSAQEHALHWRDSGSDYIREQPMKSVLMAAGAGAVLVLLAGLLLRGHGSRH